MLEWIEIREDYYKEYSSDEVICITDKNNILTGYQKRDAEKVLACNKNKTCIIGYLRLSTFTDNITCENDDEDKCVDNITYFIPVRVIIEELLKTLPNKKI